MQTSLLRGCGNAGGRIAAAKAAEKAIRSRVLAFDSGCHRIQLAASTQKKQSSVAFSSSAAAAVTSDVSDTTASSSTTTLFMWGTDAHHNKMLSPSTTTTTTEKSLTTVLDQPTPMSDNVLATAFPAAVETSPIAQVVCGPTDTAFVLENGQCFVMGENQQGQLGVGHAKPVTVPTEIQLPFFANDDGNNNKLKQVSLGMNFSAFVDEQGELYTAGFGGSAFSGMGWLGHGSAVNSVYTPTLVESLVEDGCRVDQVQVGELHMTCLTTEAEVLTTGAGSYGRLGNYDTVDQLYLEPVEVLTPAHKVVQLAGGKSFTLALTKDGLLYSWGRNHKGQLGTGLGLAVDIYAMAAVPEPLEADELMGRRVVSVAAGHSHAACVTDRGELFHWGMAQHFDPVPVNELLHTKIVHVACGHDYTLAVDEDGVLYSMGVATKGMTGGQTTGVLGQGPKVTRTSTMGLVQAFHPTESDFAVIPSTLSAGWKHAACLAQFKGEQA